MNNPRDHRLAFEEFIAILIAFSTIGAILWWGLSLKDEGVNLSPFLTPSPLPTVPPTVIPPAPTQSPASVLVIPDTQPTEILRNRLSPPSVSESLPLPLPVAKSGRFTDLPNDFWAQPFIEGLAARGIVMSKDNTFRPNEPVTRAEFANWLKEAFNPFPSQKAKAFKDIDANFSAIPEIDSATQSGFLKGYPGDVFRPEQPIPKVQVLVALVSGLKLIPSSSVIQAQVLRVYQDKEQIPNYAMEKVAAATEAGLVANYPNPKLLNPNQNATRAEVAVIIYQALIKAKKADPISSPYLVQTR
jgi:hypothetical protein